MHISTIMKLQASNGKILSKEVEQVESVQNGTGNLQQGQQGTQEQANMNDQQTAQTNTNGQQTVQISIESATQMVLDKVPGATNNQLIINLDYDDGISKYMKENYVMKASNMILK